MTVDHEIRVLPGVIGVRRRPAIYLAEGEVTAAGLVDTALRTIVSDLADPDPSPACVLTPPCAVELGLWADGVVSLHLHGVTLRLDDPYAPRAWSEPRLYEALLYMHVRDPGVTWILPILNALSERLQVTTRHGAQAYRATCAAGGLIGLLHEVEPGELVGDTVLAFRPDATVVPGELSAETCQASCAARAHRAVPVTFVDRRPARMVEW